MTWNKKNLQIIIHIAIWTGFLLLPFVNFSGPKEMPFNPERKLQVLFFITNLFLIGFYYLHSLVLIPRLLAERKIAFYVASILGMLALFIFIPIVYFHFVEIPRPRFIAHPNGTPGMMPPNRFGMKRILPFSFPGTMFMFLLILIISGGIKIINQWFRSERRTEEIEKEKISTELALLKSQINPHFLFNTLNNIYSLAVTGSQDTAAAIMKLSSIMRYVLDDAKSHFVPLDKDLQFLENYISLQKIRLTQKSTIHFTVEGNTGSKQIAPLLLIAFVENAFKYGISTHQASVIEIHCGVTERQLTFIVANQKCTHQQAEAGNTGIGLSNARRRLELLYPGKHVLMIQQEDNSFLATLTLDLL